jgi:hypothetical protein
MTRLKSEFTRLVKDLNLDQTPVRVKASPLTPQEAIGATQRQDNVLLKGKERLLQAEVRGAKGQAFTGSLGDYSGAIADILALPLATTFSARSF